MGTLADAAARLGEALDDAEDVGEGELGDEVEEEVVVVLEEEEEHKNRKAKSMAHMIAPASFAPMPSHLTWFAAHVDTISTTMNDARNNLEACVTSLWGEHPQGGSTRIPRWQRTSG
jgi:hypothetical protein